MMRKTLRWLFPVLCSLLAACGGREAPRHAFYHWKTRFAPTGLEQERMQSLHAERLYMKYFDVDWPPGEAAARPQAKVIFGKKPAVEVVPTVFITNRTVQRTGEADCPALADRIFKLIHQLHPKELPPIREVQIDCDWTQGTRAAYFALLRHLGELLEPQGVALSATIRLHQLKYPDLTGVPPVDRGMLMFYNMGDLDNPDEHNSILDLETGKQYLGRLGEYALPLDVALPIFAWGVLIREDRPIKLLNNLRPQATVGIPWMSAVADHQVRVDTNHYFWGHYLYAGDRIRFEEVAPEALLASAETIAAGLAPGPRSISLYHLDSLTLAHYDQATLQAVFEHFH